MYSSINLLNNNKVDEPIRKISKKNWQKSRQTGGKGRIESRKFTAARWLPRDAVADVQRRQRRHAGDAQAGIAAYQTAPHGVHGVDSFGVDAFGVEFDSIVKKRSPHVGIEERIGLVHFLDDGHCIDAAPVGSQDVLDEVVAEEDAVRMLHVRADEVGHGRFQLLPVALHVDLARFEDVVDVDIFLQ